jgi:hypothetical protein
VQLAPGYTFTFLLEYLVIPQIQKILPHHLVTTIQSVVENLLTPISFLGDTSCLCEGDVVFRRIGSIVLVTEPDVYAHPCLQIGACTVQSLDTIYLI